MQNFSASPRHIISRLWINRELILSLIERDIIGRYKNSYFGVFWAILNPVWMLIIYTFIFTTVFSAKWDKQIDSQYEFALILFLGLILFNIFSECSLKSTVCITSNVNYVTKVVFPLEILPIVTLGASLFHASLSLLVWYVAYILLRGEISLGILLLPIYALPLILFCAGLSWILAAVGVFMRDLVQIVNAIVSALMFLTPIFYPISALPEKFQIIIRINPLTQPIEEIRNLMVWGHVPQLHSYMIGFFMSIFCAWLGFWIFQRLRIGFADSV